MTRREALAASVAALLAFADLQAIEPEILHRGGWFLASKPGDAPKRPRGGDRGTGASIGTVLAVQTGYMDEDTFDGLPANLMTVFWENHGLNPDGIMVFANGFPVVDPVIGLPVLLDGGATFIDVFTHDISGDVRWDVVSGLFSSSDDLEILNSQPFDDPTHSCEGGPTLPGRIGCDLIVSIDCPRKPGFYHAAIDGVDLTETIPGDATEHAIPDLRFDQHCVTLLAASNAFGNDYEGDAVESCCTLTCKDSPCDAPGVLTSCQTKFGPGPENDVLVTWVPGETDYTALRATLDGKALPEMTGDRVSLALEDLMPGAHVLELSGDCSERGASEPAVLAFDLRADAPRVEGPRNISCRFTSPSAITMALAWALPASPPDSIDVFLVDPEGVPRKVLSLPGFTTGTTVEDTTRADRAGLQLNYLVQGACVASELAICAPAPPPGNNFLIADCDGNTILDLTDPVFGLNRLFQSAAEPPCEASCDSNLDGLFNISDAIFTLNHLFLGGDAPGGEYPACSTTTPEQTCQRTTCR